LEPMRELLVDIIKTLGVGTVYKAPDGKSAYRQYVIKKPDIIITDWHMPEMDGLELTEKVRKASDSPNRTTPIIMISGFNAPSRISKSRNLGVTEYLSKPFRVEDLSKRISHVVNHPRDFIITPKFVGPDRRRREDENFKDKPRRKVDTDKKIKAKKDLQQKTGKGQANPADVTRSEKVMKETKIDFTPTAKKFLKDFKEAIDAANKTKNYSQRIKENITFPIMQLKANSHIFKYDLIGELSKTTLDFLENTNEIDHLILEILNAQHSTLSHLVNTNAKGNGGEEGKSLRYELEDAYKRYNRARIAEQKAKLLQENQTD
ncbi:MAG: response regulator, partial [Alphaproteobacteria bacterium]